MKILYITLAGVVLDQVTKIFVKGLNLDYLGININGMPYGSSKPLIGDFVRLTFIENPGMAFGIDIGPKMFLTLFTIFASGFIFFYIYKHRNDGLKIRLALALILSGAIGNLIDRTFYGLIYGYAPLFHGKVVDFIQVEFWDFTIFGRTYSTWPIFNIADVLVSVGFLIILLFHNRIFKPKEDEAVITESTEVSDKSIQIENHHTENINDITPEISRSIADLNLSKETTQLEDTEKDSHSSSSGSVKAED